MCKDKQIVLVGFPGCGKTTIGKKLGRFLDLDFLDLDEIIEQKEQQSVAGIFNNKGEDYFRKTEHELLQQIFRSENRFVLAVGGGTPCFYDNMDMINRYAVSIFLNVPVNILISRIMQNPQKRPLFGRLSESEIKTSVKDMFTRRLPFYEKANIHIQNPDKSSKSIRQIAEAVKNFSNNPT